MLQTCHNAAHTNLEITNPEIQFSLVSNASKFDLMGVNDALPDWKEDHGLDVRRCRTKLAIGFRSSFSGLLTLLRIIEKPTIAPIQNVEVLSTGPERYFDILRDTLSHGVSY